MTETAAVADYVLPAASFLERTELHAHAKHQIVSVTREVVSWPGVQGEYDVLARPRRCVWASASTSPGRTRRRSTAGCSSRPGSRSRSWRRIPRGSSTARRGPRRWKETGFDTPSGKVEFASQYLKDLGLRRAARCTAARPTGASLDAAYPFVLITGARKLLYLHSRFRNIPRFLHGHPRPRGGDAPGRRRRPRGGRRRHGAGHVAYRRRRDARQGHGSQRDPRRAACRSRTAGRRPT